MDEETKQLIMNLVNKLEEKPDKSAGGTPPNSKGPLPNPQGTGNMRGLNCSKLQTMLVPDPHFFRKLMGIDI